MSNLKMGFFFNLSFIVFNNIILSLFFRLSRFFQYNSPIFLLFQSNFQIVYVTVGISPNYFLIFELPAHNL